MKEKKKAQDLMLDHSKAKVEFYQKYLEIYLSVLCKSEFYDHIYIYDVFCGRGVYDDGGLGSPIRAVETIKKVRENTGSKKYIHLVLNDMNPNHTDNVRRYIEEHYKEQDFCYISYHNKDAEVLLDTLSLQTGIRSKNRKNLFFIDPYGYKNIHKDTLQRILANGQSEILLFLPISFMHRFRHYAFEEDCNEGAKQLRKFITSFFPVNHPICTEQEMSAKTYIKHLTSAFTFRDNFFATSYYIERDAKNLFALFFMCSNIYGFEKILEVKWKLNEKDGRGFEQPKQMADLFADFEKEEIRKEQYEELRTSLIDYLSVARTNGEIYKFVLKKEYLPKHANEVLRDLQNNNQINVTLGDSKKLARKGSFYLSYKDSKDIYYPKAIIELIK